MKEPEISVPRDRPAPKRSGVAFLIVVIAIAVAGIALMNIVTKNRTHSIGRRQAMVEKEIADLEAEIRSLDMKIGEALSRKNLTDRLTSQRSKLKTILPGNIIKVPPAPVVPEAGVAEPESAPESDPAPIPEPRSTRPQP